MLTASGVMLDNWARLYKLQRKKRFVRGLESDADLRRRIVFTIHRAAEKAALDHFNQAQEQLRKYTS